MSESDNVSGGGAGGGVGEMGSFNDDVSQRYDSRAGVFSLLTHGHTPMYSAVLLGGKMKGVGTSNQGRL